MNDISAQLARIDLETLKLFTEVAARRSFAAVAAERELAPSSVSRSIAQLEAALGLRLLQRTTRRMTLTEGGQRFYRRSLDLIDEMLAAAEEARGTVAAPRGRLRLTASVAFGEHKLVPLFEDFARRYPVIDLELLLSDRNLDLVAEGIDLALRLAPAIEGDLVQSRLLTTRYAVCASPAYLPAKAAPTQPQDLGDHDCLRLTLPGYRSAWRFRRGETEVSVPVQGRLAVSSPLSLRSLALRGCGPALLADWLVAEDLAAGRLKVLLDDWQVTATSFDTALWLVYPNRQFLPQKVRLMIDTLRTALAGAP